MSSKEPLKYNKENEKTKKVDLDTILIEELGQFGPFQLRTLIIASYLLMLRTWAFSEYMFTTGKIDTRCYIPGCDTDNPVYSPEWVLSAIPSAGGLDNCHRYANITELPTNGTCSAQMFNSSHIQPCDAFVYENNNTVVFDFELACDEWRRSLIGTARMSGMFAALPITGYISDRWGRRTALAFNVFNAPWLGIMRYWSNSYIVFLCSEFFENVFSGGIFTSATLIAMEVLGPKYRVIGGFLTNSFMSLGQISIGLIAMMVPNWRNLTLTVYAPQFLNIAIVFMMSESVRWTMSKGRYTEAEALLKKIAKVNKKNISEDTLEALKFNYAEQNRKQEEEKYHKTEWLIIEVFKNKSLLLRCLICPIFWIAKSFIYVGLSINATTISGNKYLNFVAAGCVEIPAHLLAIYMLNKVGRKPVLAAGFLTCAACQAAYIFISKDQYQLSLIVFLIGKFTTGFLFLASIIYTTELYPTQQRHRLLAFSTFMGTVGGMLAPLTPAFSAATFPEMSFLLFGSIACLAGLLVFLLPETLNAKLPDTMQDTQATKKDTNTSILLQKK